MEAQTHKFRHELQTTPTNATETIRNKTHLHVGSESIFKHTSNSTTNDFDDDMFKTIFPNNFEVNVTTTIFEDSFRDSILGNACENDITEIVTTGKIESNFMETCFYEYGSEHYSDDFVDSFFKTIVLKFVFG